MMPTGKVVKITAKTAMRGNSLNLICAACVLLFVCIINQLIFSVLAWTAPLIIALAVSIALSIFVILPLFFSAFGFYRRAIWGVHDSPAELFSCFSDKKTYIRALSVGSFFFMRIFLTLAIFSLPAYLASWLSSEAFYSAFGIQMPAFAPSFSVISVILQIIGIILTVIVNIKYYLVPFLMVSNESLSLSEAARLSRTISRTSALELFWLVLSMAGWIICSILIIPLVFTVPYFFCCYTVHCRFCVAEYNRSVSRTDDTTPTYNP